LAKSVQKASRPKNATAKRAGKKAVGCRLKAARKKTPAAKKKPAARKRATPKKRTVRKKSPAKKKSATSKKKLDGLPVELSGEAARRVWRETEPLLRDRLNLLDIDHRILVLYCNCWQLLTECQEVLRTEGRYVTMEDTGYVSRHPAAVDEKNTIAQIRQLAGELGMTPKAGRRVKVRTGDGDQLKAFLEGKPE